MKTKTITFCVGVGLAVLTAAWAQGATNDSSPAAKNQGIPPEVLQFAAAKEAQAKKLAHQLDVKVSPDLWPFFAAAKKGDFPGVTSKFARLRKRAGQYEGSRNDPQITNPVWQTVIETLLAYEQTGTGDPHYSRLFASQIIDSIPAGSIYFGGTDPGRGLVTLHSKSHEQANPFFTLTQNALADENYLSYLRAMYGSRIYIPTQEDSQHAFNEYLTDAQARLKEHKLKPGEDVRIVNDRVQVSGQIAVMAINGLLVSNIFIHNTNQQFFIEESFPLDWMYAWLRPHGLIMKLERNQVESISPEEVLKDQQFWTAQTTKMIGEWLKPESDLKAVCDFARIVFRDKDFKEYHADPAYVGNTNACMMFSKCRSSIAGVYDWRAKHSSSTEEARRMRTAADFAYRQAFALCPYSPEAVFRYANLLLEQGDTVGALRIAQAALLQNPDNEQIQGLEQQIREKRRQ